MGRRSAAIAAALLTLALTYSSAGFGPPPARADFGFSSLSSSFTEAGGEAPAALSAGSHPEFWTTTLAFDTTGAPGEEHPDGALKDLRITLPPGLVGGLSLLPACPRADFRVEACPAATRIGTTSLAIGSEPEPVELPLYLLDPAPGIAAQLGLHLRGTPVTFDLSLLPGQPLNLIAEISNASQADELFGATLTLRGVVDAKPFLTLPRSCTSPLVTHFAARSWAPPQAWVAADAPDPQAITDCASLAYDPELQATPTTASAAAPSGLDLDLDAPDAGLVEVDGRAAADTASATLVLPPGMTVNPPVAAGLVACTAAQLAGERAEYDPATGCPEAAKIGSATVLTPLFAESIGGAIYVAQPDDPATPTPGAENPFDTLLALYLVLRDPARGVVLSLPIRIDADPRTGRLSAGLTQIPPLPLSHLSMRFNSGPRAPLTTPPRCGDHAIEYALTPSSANPAIEGEEEFATTSGCDRPFAPTISAGTTSTSAGSTSPLVLELGNPAGAPNLGDIHLDLPPGLSADLTAAETCPAAGAATGLCPPASRVGFTRIAVGSGPEPLWVAGGSRPDSGVYLAGAYGGAPFSLLVSVPAAAGPFDLGRVVVRAPARIDPDTARISVDLPDLPQIRNGIPLDYRAIRLVLDRPGFVRNPTSCEPMGFRLTATAATGATATASERFQAADCGALRFRPRLAVRLSGAVGRNGHPRVGLDLVPKPGQANLAAARFDLPPGELLDTRNIRALCVRDLPPARCPASARLGRATLRSPLLPEPLRGPIFLRAPGGRYPDLLADLHGGGVHIRVHGTTASARGGRLRIQLRGLPDIPLSRASIVLAGGRRGIVVNSASPCPRPPRAAAMLQGHNGREALLRPRVRPKGRC